jgi:hypothetical protein
MRTGLVPIIASLTRWLTENYDSGFDPVDDESAAIRIRALLILDQLELLRAKVQKQQMEKAE